MPLCQTLRFFVARREKHFCFNCKLLKFKVVVVGESVKLSTEHRLNLSTATQWSFNLHSRWLYLHPNSRAVDQLISWSVAKFWAFRSEVRLSKLVRRDNRWLRRASDLRSYRKGCSGRQLFVARIKRSFWWKLSIWKRGGVWKRSRWGLEISGAALQIFYAFEFRGFWSNLPSNL